VRRLLPQPQHPEEAKEKNYEKKSLYIWAQTFFMVVKVVEYEIGGDRFLLFIPPNELIDISNSGPE